MNGLNPQQHAAVTTLDCPLLVIAGAGSGKTRVITEKIAYLIRQGTPARHIVAVTFTNKAAREMKSRVGKLADDKSLRGLTVSTFHALGLEIVRREHKALELKSAISIFDEQDRQALLRELIRHGDHRFDPEQADAYAARISRWKNRFITPDRARSLDEPDAAGIAALYEAYMHHMKAYNAVDFDDLILLPVMLFQRHPEVLDKWRNQIRYLLVDEYQDTNQTQYELIKLLTGTLGKFTVVGDDDQSIYAWRGAQPENLAQLRNDFPRLKVIKLEQNYRSMGRILKAANQLIGNNPHIFEKKLWSAMGQGDPIRVLRHRDEIAEARQIAADIVHHKFRHNTRFADYAILYRGNHQSRLFERALREFSVPYHISGGTSFFGYTEVKDVMAYLRLLVNPDDDAAFLRIVNVPRREIGPTTLEKLGQYANRRHISLYAACFELGLEQSLPANAVQRLRRFGEHIADTADRTARGDVFKIIDDFLGTIGYENWVRENSSDAKAAERKFGNVRELLDWLRRIAEKDGENRSLAETVAKATLLDVLDRNQEDDTGDRVSLMTLHAAKGLEFPYVYLVGMEENLLPHQTSIDEDNIEEERRLAYVGITRARRDLTLSYCSHRKRYGEMIGCEPSRFLAELPQEDLEWPDRQPLDPETKRERGRASLAQLRNLLSD
ncbi:DNA helicase Rep [Methylococcus capsulatus]|uniref:DNA helicase Rep n=1 Tax=Methylococcus capsulatus TaxID=414 RepID=UPI001C52D559|nr:DNA helicase Rep [Methylococcus capsulatus]QXP87254.1 DNA helicase Rep [Methylococcus capsulatus]QXP93005.1 DNA helicase Rep [Methylococcus capsulatus]UQN12251.1 DNA helicase Rep [Methylococcus capsulatus]